LWVGPVATGSVEPLDPSSGVLVLPTTPRPACFHRRMVSLSWSATTPLKKRLPPSVGTPA